MEPYESICKLSESTLNKVLIFSLKISAKKLWRGLLLPKNNSEEMNSYIEKRIKFKEEMLT